MSYKYLNTDSVVSSFLQTSNHSRKRTRGTWNMKPVCSAFNIAYSVQKTHVKAADSIFFSHLDRILHINLRTNSHITSKEHVSPLILPHHRLNKVSGTSTLRRRGRPTGAGGMFPHRVMGGKVKQRCTSEACKWIVSSPFTLQILGKHSIWD